MTINCPIRQYGQRAEAAAGTAGSGSAATGSGSAALGGDAVVGTPHAEGAEPRTSGCWRQPARWRQPRWRRSSRLRPTARFPCSW